MEEKELQRPWRKIGGANASFGLCAGGVVSWFKQTVGRAGTYYFTSGIETQVHEVLFKTASIFCTNIGY